MNQTTNTICRFLLAVVISCGLAACADLSQPFANPGDDPTSAEAGGSQCANCHSDKYEEWIDSGHGYKINAVRGAAPTYPSFVPSVFDETGLMAPPPIFPNGWADITYIIGGYGWKARFIDSNGYILTSGDGGSPTAQYNLERTDIAAGAMAEAVAYSSTTAYPTKEYNCGYCHTTGWDADKQQGGLAGMTGGWDYDGITCQRCHGYDTLGGPDHNPATKTADGPDIPDVGGKPTINNFANLASDSQMNNVCSDCHVRYTGSDIHTIDPNTVPVSKKFIRHHEQSQELFVGQHAGRNVGCTSCHDPHASTRYDAEAAGEGVYTSKISNGDCTGTCHTSVTVNSGYGTVHTCVDCHMPYLVKSARSFTVGNKLVPGVTALGTPTTDNKRGDIRSHIFALSTAADATFLDAHLDGSAGQLKIPVDFTCMTCHGTGGTEGPTTAAGAEAALSLVDVHP